MPWVLELFRGESVAQAVIVLSLVAATGLAIGSIRLFGVGLGIAGVLFSGLVFGHFGLTINEAVQEFAREFGLILFVYSIGLHVGPGFIDSLRRQGLSLNLMAAAIVLGGAAVTVALIYLADLPVPVAAGLFSGATTNTPSLAAAQQALKDVPGYTPSMAALPGLGYAVAYPFGIIGIILTMLLVRVAFRVSIQREAAALKEQERATRPGGDVVRRHIQVKNPNLEGVLLRDVPLHAEEGVVVSRVLQAGEVRIATPETRLHLDDILLAVGPKERLDDFRVLVGIESPIDLTAIETAITTRRLIVTRRGVLGKTVEELELPSRHGVTITRVNRAGIEFAPGPEVRLQAGDTVLAVGQPDAIERVAAELGNATRPLGIPEVIPIFVGIALGIFIGSWPFNLPGVPAPVKLGLAGGPLLAAIILSRIGRVGPLVWYLPQSANLMLREVGIVLFLAAVGLRSGDRFVETLLQGQGFVWMGLAALITLLPLLAVALIARALVKLNYLSLTGLLAGSMTDPPALAFAGAFTGSEAPSVAYATVYPLTMILRVLCGQMLVLLLMR
ncbi:MAG: putative transporter [Armatimonadetes bacterium]|jgi:putative transport protein|nr:putative transporter [Armatimonadota bacterium]